MTICESKAPRKLSLILKSDDIVIDSSDYAQLSIHLERGQSDDGGNTSDSLDLENYSKRLKNFSSFDDDSHSQANSLKSNTIEPTSIPQFSSRISLSTAQELESDTASELYDEDNQYERRNSLLVASRRNSLMSTASVHDVPRHSTMQRRSSYIIAAEILGDAASANELEETKNDLNELLPSESKFNAQFSENIADFNFDKSSRKHSLLVPGQFSRRNSIICTNDSFDTSTRPRKRRASLLISSEILDGDFGESIRGKRKFSRRNSVVLPNAKMKKRDSFLINIDAMDLEGLSPAQRRNSLLVASEILNMANEDTLRPPKAKTIYLKDPKENNMKSFEEKGAFHNFMAETFPDEYASIHKSMNGFRPAKKPRRISITFNSFTPNEIPRPIPTNTHFSQDNSPNGQIIQMPPTARGPSGNLMSLCQAMKSSEESQIRIHDWDRKMGLRRSHSKTMRNSMRSRKYLLQYANNRETNPDEKKNKK